MSIILSNPLYCAVCPLYPWVCRPLVMYSSEHQPARLGTLHVTFCISNFLGTPSFATPHPLQDSEFTFETWRKLSKQVTLHSSQRQNEHRRWYFKSVACNHPVLSTLRAFFPLMSVTNWEQREAGGTITRKQISADGPGVSSFADPELTGQLTGSVYLYICISVAARTLGIVR
jgi:hypothetical protein